MNTVNDVLENLMLIKVKILAFSDDNILRVSHTIKIRKEFNNMR